MVNFRWLYIYHLFVLKWTSTASFSFKGDLCAICRPNKCPMDSVFGGFRFSNYWMLFVDSLLGWACPRRKKCRKDEKSWTFRFDGKLKVELSSVTILPWSHHCQDQQRGTANTSRSLGTLQLQGRSTPNKTCFGMLNPRCPGRWTIVRARWDHQTPGTPFSTSMIIPGKVMHEYYQWWMSSKA